LVIATNGEFTKAYHINFKKTLTLNGEEVKDFFTEKEALSFIEQPHLITQENKVVLSRRELIKIFAEANDLLRKKGLQAGDERFSEFANILFLKIISEIEESKEKSAVEKRHLWNSWATEEGDNLKSRIDKALEHFQKKYQEGELFSISKIEDAKTLEEIVSKLNPLSLVETERDVKGEAFEYFLQRYNAGEKDLGQYFTPRHVIRHLVNILQPRFGDKVYDPFCGTGGMLIECFKYVSERIKIDLENLKILRNSFYGNEITNVARITKMNMILFGDGHNNIQRRDTFQFPVNEEYDLIITNIPFGFDDIDHGNLYHINCKYGDCLAIQHCLKACKENGRVAMIMPEGFFTQKIKKYQDTKK
jgi:type I restriction enzyme M protein